MKLVIVGGVAGGASAAARARRLDEHAEILLLQSGPDVSYASCGMPYYIGGEITCRASMSVQTPQSLHDRLNITVRTQVRVTKIDTERKMIDVLNERTGESVVESYDQLILAVGAMPFKPNIAGIDRPGLFALRNLEDMDEIYRWIHNQSAKHPDHKMHCVVAGAGFVGLEMVEQLLHRGNIQVTLVEMMQQILSPLDEEMAAVLQHDLEMQGVTVIVNDGIQEFLPDPADPDASSILRLSSGRVVPSAQMTILGLGVRPDTSIIQASGIKCTSRGHIVVNKYLQTSVPNVWAVGDAIEVTNPILAPSDHSKWAIPLAGPANRQGRLVADNIFLKSSKEYAGTYGVSIMRCNALYAACVGMNAKMLSSQNISFQAVHIHPSSHAVRLTLITS
jgi:NADPH-dependent 2,4-dienoyl-CoA reductase/sulfur reductase-like enzyme